MTNLQDADLHLPENFHYDCVMCGRGCADFWEIPVDEESEKLLANYDLKPHQQRLTKQSPIISSEFDSGKCLNRENDVCTFLKDDKACALHEALGPKIKPQACIDFPFRYVDTPGGTYVGLSFACTAVLQESGRQVSERRNELLEGYRSSTHKSNASDRVQLTGRLSLDFDAYAKLEEVFDEILNLHNVPLSRRLHCISQFTDIAVEAFRAMRLQGESEVELSVDEQLAGQQANDIEIIEGLKKRFSEDNWGRLLARGVRQAKSPAVHRAFVGLVATFRQALWRGSNRFTASLYIGKNYLSHALMLGSVRLKPLESKINYRSLKKLWPTDDPKSEREILLTRFFRHYLFRKDLLLAETIQSGVYFMLLHYAMVNWYQVAFQIEWKEGHTETEILQEALRTVEKYYINHSRFTEYLEQQPLLATMLESIMNGRNFAASILAPPLKKMYDFPEE